MPAKGKRQRSDSNRSLLAIRVREFLADVGKSKPGRHLLLEQNHRVQFEIVDGKPFYIEILNGKISVQSGEFQPRRFDSSDLIHFRLSEETLEKLLDGKMRFTDALIPTEFAGRNSIALLECTLFKWSVLNWIGRLFRVAQTEAGE